MKVVDAGKPVAGASLMAKLGYLEEQTTKTDEKGIARLDLLPTQSLTHLTAWTDDFRIGGYGFDRTPARVPREDEHIVQISDCRDLKMRFVDASGDPVPGLDLKLHVASPSPDINTLVKFHTHEWQPID